MNHFADILFPIAVLIGGVALKISGVDPGGGNIMIIAAIVGGCFVVFFGE